MEEPNVPIADHKESLTAIFGTMIWQKFFAVFIVISVSFMMLISQNVKKPTQEDRQAGTLCMELSWPDDANMDVDLWVKAPNGDVVGYRGHNSQHMDLLRDDLGLDISGENRETTCTRGILEGTYKVNAVWYGGSNPSYSSGIPLKLYVVAKIPNNGRQEFVKSANLPRHKSEVTVLSFRVSANHRIITSSFNQIRTPIFLAE